MIQKHIHFQNRAGFGVAIVDQEIGAEPHSNVDSYLADNATEKSIDVIAKPRAANVRMQNVSKENLKQRFQKTRQETIKLNHAWLGQMSTPGVAAREKMTLFWHDHFACRTGIAYLAQQQNNTIRKNALGSFENLLMAVSKDPAMLQFLNNQQNRKDSPNENFAREVMELFTLGRGHYTEADVKNAARAFTGWAFNPLTGEFVFRPGVHDAGNKVFRGHWGNFKGEDIIDMLLADKRTARFITEKIWTYFVSTQIRDEGLIASLSSDFHRNNYNLSKLMKWIYTSDWFYQDRFVGNRIKSPVELLTSIQLHTNGTFQDELSTAFVQKALGQLLFFPPNVGGWPAGKEWIDSSSLTFRLSLPGILFGQEVSDFRAKEDGDMNNLVNGVRKSKVAFSVDWISIAKCFAREQSAVALAEVESFLLAVPPRKENRNVVQKYALAARSDIEFIQRAYLGFMSLPEYQLS